MKALPSSKKPLEYYLDLKYPMEIVEDDGSWVASIPDLPGCASYGDTVTEALDNVQKTKKLWIEGQYLAGVDIPEPTEEDDYSGKFVLRIPRILHRNLAYEARKQGVSLNHYASHLLSERQPLDQFHTLAHNLLNTYCPSSWRGPWLFSHHEHDSSVMLGKLPGNTEFVVCLRKPPAESQFKMLIPSGTKKLYLNK